MLHNALDGGTRLPKPSLLLPSSEQRAVMEESANMMFPSTGMHILSALIHLLGVSILAHIISSRWSSLRGASWPKMCLMIVYIDSYLFIFVAGVLILGAGMEHSKATCSLGIHLCIVFYASSKVFVYWFLGEAISNKVE